MRLQPLLSPSENVPIPSNSDLRVSPSDFCEGGDEENREPDIRESGSDSPIHVERLVEAETLRAEGLHVVEPMKLAVRE